MLSLETGLTGIGGVVKGVGETRSTSSKALQAAVINNKVITKSTKNTRHELII